MLSTPHIEHDWGSQWHSDRLPSGAFSRNWPIFLDREHKIHKFLDGFAVLKPSIQVVIGPPIEFLCLFYPAKKTKALLLTTT